MAATTHGTFEVTITPEAQESAGDAGPPASRMALEKTFTGGMTGEARGTMLAIGRPGANSGAAYVALDRFTGRVDGRAGGFVLVHRGTIDRAGRSELAIVIAPDSGTCELAGIAGTFSLDVRDGVHHYALTYTLA